MAVETWLIDKSALARLDLSPEVDEWASRIERGLVFASTIARLEVGFSARSAAELRQLSADVPMSSVITANLTPSIEARALGVQLLLAEAGHHRSAGIPDLLIAATAELSGHTVLHVDKDFELIASVTGQPHEWLSIAR